MYDNEGPASMELKGGSTIAQHSSTLRTRIRTQRDFHESELKKLTEIEKLLDENPAIEKFQDLINRTRL